MHLRLQFTDGYFTKKEAFRFDIIHDMFRTLVVIHLYYPQLWKELLECVWSIDGEKDVLVTYGDESAVAEARRDLPEARFIRCENRGFDVWPFLFAL